MKALIIEDEVMASQALCKLIGKVSPETEVVDVLQTIAEAKDWFKNNPMPDLIFMDIHLADGSSFAIFERTQITCPIIFTTAYDEYALKAFEVSSIDYLLKPINRNDLTRAMNKFQMLAGARFNADKIERLLEQLGEKKRYRSYFLLPERDKLVPLSTKDIAYAYIDAKSVKIVTHEHKNYYLTHTLDDLMAQLDPVMFFRANRQFIVSREAIKDVSIWFGNKLAINLNVEVPEKIIVSKAKVAEFKCWFSS